MGIETLNAMNEARLSLMIIKLIAFMTFFLAIAGFITYLIGLAWFCFRETRRGAHRRTKQAQVIDKSDSLAAAPVPGKESIRSSAFY